MAGKVNRHEIRLTVIEGGRHRARAKSWALPPFPHRTVLSIRRTPLQGNRTGIPLSDPGMRARTIQLAHQLRRQCSPVRFFEISNNSQRIHFKAQETQYKWNPKIRENHETFIC